MKWNLSMHHSVLLCKSVIFLFCTFFKHSFLGCEQCIKSWFTFFYSSRGTCRHFFFQTGWHRFTFWRSVWHVLSSCNSLYINYATTGSVGVVDLVTVLAFGWSTENVSTRAVCWLLSYLNDRDWDGLWGLVGLGMAGRLLMKLFSSLSNVSHSLWLVFRWWLGRDSRHNTGTNTFTTKII